MQEDCVILRQSEAAAASIKKICAHASLIVHHTTTISIAISSLRESAACQYLVQPCGAGTKPVRDLIGGLFPQPRAEAFVAASLPCSPRCSAVRTTDRTYCAMLLVGLSDHHLHVMVEVYALLNMEFSVTCSCLLLVASAISTVQDQFRTCMVGGTLIVSRLNVSGRTVVAEQTNTLVCMQRGS